MFDWYSAWHTTNETMLTSVAEAVPTDGAHTFSLRVYDTAGHQGAATVTFTASNTGSGGGGWTPPGGEETSDTTKWLILGGIIVLALFFGGKRGVRRR
ncbi:hypothetical protein DRJ25_05675 [Candidatus Woesearchaeota archaeon]|nr:MAG: hypothetical protein DRJ25_05675 [Candidatus Woesearchaeota archaeon]